MKKYEIDMCEGPLLGKILIFTFPLMASGILQLLFNAADMVVVGRYAGSNSLGAVGATSSLVNLLVNVFMGLSVGANVAVAHYYGAKRYDELSKSVHTAISLSIICGGALLLIGWFLSGPILEMMSTPVEILPLSAKYLKVYFLGAPAMLVYNFGAAILRAVGDTKRPLYILLWAGAINVVLNLIFVIAFGMDVEGVALATDLSQLFSAILIVRCLMKDDAAYRLDLRKLAIDIAEVKRIAQVGLPAGIQGSIFSISNVLIQSSVNSFGAIVVAGNTATCNLEGFIYVAMNSFHQTALSFTGQNMGAKRMDRVKRVLGICLICVTVTGLSLGLLGWLFGRQLLGIYADSSEVIEYGMRRMAIIFPTYFTCGFMDVLVGSIRGMGFSIMPMIVSLMGACAFRVVWIFTVFRMSPSLERLYISYPISWVLTSTVHIICILLVARPKFKNLK